MDQRQEDSHEFLYFLMQQLESEMPEWSEKLREIFTMNPDSGSVYNDQPYLVTPASKYGALEEGYEHIKDHLIMGPNVMFHVYRLNSTGYGMCYNVFKFPVQFEIHSKFYCLNAVVAQSGESVQSHYIAYIRVQKMQ
jgi:ubiquitin C-terminal hydrolase